MKYDYQNWIFLFNDKVSKFSNTSNIILINFQSFLETYFEIELVKKLEITIEKQRNEIKKLDQSVIDYKAENEEVYLTINKYYLLNIIKIISKSDYTLINISNVTTFS